MRTKIGPGLAAIMCAGLLSGCAYLARASETETGVSPLGENHRPDLSFDGRYVAFDSTAALDPADTNGVMDVFVRDNQTGAITRVSVATNGDAANSHSSGPSISEDGRFVAFESQASNLTTGDTNLVSDVYWHDRDTDADGIFDEPGAIRTVVASGGPLDPVGNGPSIHPAIDTDGGTVVIAFESIASNFDTPTIPDTNGVTDIYVAFFDSRTGGPLLLEPLLVSISVSDGLANGPSRSPDVRLGSVLTVPFSTEATNLTDTPDTNNHEDVVVSISTPSFASIVIKPVTAGGPLPNDDQFLPQLVGDTTKIAYTSAATNLAPGDTGGHLDVFVTDWTTGTTSCLSRTAAGTEANGDSIAPSPSADGTRVAFESTATDLVPGDTNRVSDVFVRAASGLTQRASMTVLLQQAGDWSGEARISGDGVHIAFASLASNLETPDTNTGTDLFVRAAVVPEIDNVVAIDPNTQAEIPPVLHVGTNELLVKGRGFGPAVIGRLGTGVTVTVLSVLPDEVRLQALVPAGTAVGPRTLSVSNLGSGIGAANGSTGACPNCVQIAAP